MLMKATLILFLKLAMTTIVITILFSYLRFSVDTGDGEHIGTLSLLDLVICGALITYFIGTYIAIPVLFFVQSRNGNFALVYRILLIIALLMIPFLVEMLMRGLFVDSIAVTA